MGCTALIVTDMINTYEHEDADALVDSVRTCLPGVEAVLRRARSGDSPVIYVNDNFGRWRSHHGEILQAALAGKHSELVEPIAPDEDSLFVVKARHSAFFETPLAYLLGQLGAERIVLCGQVTEQCVLYSALDAYIRHLDVVVADDAVAHINPDLAEAALRMMERNMSADIRPSHEITFNFPPPPG
ncbi:isochorismatase family cysteine hydrolase [Streptomyces sp. A0592]|uniref:isochorismatase family cysteine hydrolase n=1 Tax=Streptomyces sp. A0592 TaxID=2563099 RepID=UPI00109E5D72|nr:isochorismatase family cysteine hydrolase [Streptomyces sp. A0592]THA76176.1 cysteine hydrolase [Streptomyces sp. A0592]